MEYAIYNKLYEIRFFKLLKKSSIIELKHFLRGKDGHVEKLMKNFYKSEMSMNVIFYLIGKLFRFKQSEENILYIIDLFKCNKKYYETIYSADQKLSPCYYTSYFITALNYSQFEIATIIKNVNAK